MKTIHKFQLYSTTKIVLPWLCKILYVGIQGKYTFVWVEYDSSAPKTYELTVNMYGTGWELPEDPGSWIGSVISSDGFVRHFYGHGRLLERQ